MVNYIRTLNIDEQLARVELATNKVRYYHADALGSIIGLSNEAGQMVTQYAYDPFGQVTISGEASDNPFQYTGRENDGTGLYYYRARYYSPELQRFVSEDPIRLAGGDVNYFAYVKNKPVNYTDALGLKGCGTGWIGSSGLLDYPLGHNFKSCCDEHDDCYGCRGESEGKKKLDCDFKFCKCVVTKCLSFPSMLPCPAMEYCFAVVFGGKPAFDKARNKETNGGH